MGVCRRSALRVGTGYILVDWERCDGCGKCADFCDRGAIVLRSAAPVHADAPHATPGTYAAIAAANAPEQQRGSRLASALRGLLPKGDPETADAASSAARHTAPAHAIAPAPAPSWSLPEAVLVLVVSFALLVGVQSVFGGSSVTPGIAGMVLVAYDTGLLAMLAFFVLRRGIGALAAFRLDVMPEIGSALLALGLFVGLRVFVVGYTLVVSAAGYGPPTEGADLTTLFGSGPLGAVTTVLVVAVLGPLLEEVALRGVLLSALKTRIGAVASVVVTAVAFSLLHVSAWSFVPLTALGLALGWLAVRSRSLWPAVLLHVAYNGLILASAFRAAGKG